MSKKKKEKELTSRELLFVHEYLIDKKKGEAAIRAGYSKRSASAQACRLLKNVKIKALIDEGLRQQQERLKVNADRVLDELGSISTADIRKAFNEDGTLKRMQDMPDDLARCISSVEVDEIEEFNHETKQKEFIGYTRKIKFWDKVKSLELLGKHYKLFAERMIVEDGRGRAERIKRARERAQKGEAGHE